MKNLLTMTAMLAVCAGAGAALAQDDQTTTQTTVTQSPDTTTKTTVTSGQDVDGLYTKYRKTVTSTRQFHIGEWKAPADFTVHHFDLGQRLPGDLLVDSYYLNDYGTYELVAPPEGTVWVRVGSDAYLVRRDNGEVIQADTGIFD